MLSRVIPKIFPLPSPSSSLLYISRGARRRLRRLGALGVGRVFTVPSEKRWLKSSEARPICFCRSALHMGNIDRWCATCVLLSNEKDFLLFLAFFVPKMKSLKEKNNSGLNYFLQTKSQSSVCVSVCAIVYVCVCVCVSLKNITLLSALCPWYIFRFMPNCLRWYL